MATQDWRSPYSLASDSTPAPPPPPPPRVLGYELRPLAVGEVLDRVFSLYRANFWLLCGLSAVSAGVSVGVAILRLIYLHFSSLQVGSSSYTIITIAIGFVQSGLYLIAYSLTVAATTSAVNALYLGEPTSLRIALRAARRLWLRCLGIAFWQGWSAVWIFFVLIIPLSFMSAFAGTGFGAAGMSIVLVLGILASLVYGVIAYLRNSLAVPAAVIEGLGVRKAMRRSKSLATGRIGRIFLLILLVYALWMIAGVIQIPLALLLVRSRASEQFVLQGLILTINFIATSIVGPIAAIGLCLFYFDERVRREGFDIEFMLHGASITSPVMSPVIVPAAEPPPAPVIPEGNSAPEPPSDPPLPAPEIS